jgi:hypothetical protein
MKKLITLLFICAFVVSFAQDTLVPDFKNQPMLLQGDKLVKLEKQTSEQKAKMKGMGYGGTSMFILLLGEFSPVTASSNPTFYIKVEDDVDPESVYYLTKVTKANSKGREIEIMRTSAFAGYGAKGKSTKKDDVACTYEKVEGNIFKFSPNAPLAAGEYAFISVAQGGAGSAQSLVFAFGVK